MQEELHETILAQWLSGEISDEQIIAEIGAEEFATLQRAVGETAGLEPPPFDAEAAFAALDLEEEDETPVRKLNSRAWWTAGLGLAAAAAIALLIIFLPGGGETEGKTFATAQGEQQNVQLPDGSQVKLNAASNLAYAANWEEERRVSLEGEAFFEVEKGKTFTVGTDAGAVEVLGTSFNVRVRDGALRVECFTGKVRVTNAKGKELAILQPGQFVENRREDNPQVGTFAVDKADWRDGFYDYKGTPFPEVIREVENQLGIKIEYPEELKERNFLGSFSINKREEMFNSLCIPYNLQWKESTETTVTLYK